LSSKATNIAGYRNQNDVCKKADESVFSPRNCFPALLLLAEQLVRMTPDSLLGTLIADAE
jgi:hypothetical protein